jgi:Icc-related predicted phosphoesterase
MTRILLIGDIHGNINSLLDCLHFASSLNIDLIITVGDIGPDILGDRIY